MNKRLPVIALSETVVINTFWQGILTITLERKTAPWVSGKNVAFGARQTCTLLPTLPLNTCVTLGNSLTLFDFQFPYVQNQQRRNDGSDLTQVF